MQTKLMYLGAPGTTPAPVIQVPETGKAVLTSIRLSAPSNNNAKYNVYHLRHGSVAINTTEALAYEVQLNSKHATEFLTHPLPVSPGESIWVSGEHIAIAVYGVIYP